MVREPDEEWLEPVIESLKRHYWRFGANDEGKFFELIGAIACGEHTEDDIEYAKQFLTSDEIEDLRKFTEWLSNQM